MAKLIDGKAIREQELDRLGRRVSELKSEGISPSLAVIIVGSDHASRIYVNNKKAACERTGIISIEHALPEETTTAELLELIDSLNADPAVSGILCQLPVPKATPCSSAYLPQRMSTASTRRMSAGSR